MRTEEEEEEKLEGPTTSSSSFLLRPRREPFEHGLLPIPKLIFTDGTLTLNPIKNRLLRRNPNGADPDSISEELGIPAGQAQLVLDALAAVLPSSPSDRRDPTVHELVLFLYIQSYKRLVPRSHKDSAAVADVWPSTSAFDGYLSALSPIHVSPKFSLFRLFRVTWLAYDDDDDTLRIPIPALMLHLKFIVLLAKIFSVLTSKLGSLIVWFVKLIGLSIS